MIIIVGVVLFITVFIAVGLMPESPYKKNNHKPEFNKVNSYRNNNMGSNNKSSKL